MTQPSALSPEAVLRGYFHAKDENRPHLLADVFAADATLKVVNNADNIAFPAVTQGREAIADVFVRRFAQTYENIYSFYLTRPPLDPSPFSCAWLVGMTEKASKSVRVGCGRYDWTFQTSSPPLASHLVITIEAMQLLPPSVFQPVFAWLRHLDYPWTSADEVKQLAPDGEWLTSVLQRIGPR